MAIGLSVSEEQSRARRKRHQAAPCDPRGPARMIRRPIVWMRPGANAAATLRPAEPASSTALIWAIMREQITRVEWALSREAAPAPFRGAERSGHYWPFGGFASSVGGTSPPLGFSTGSGLRDESLSAGDSGGAGGTYDGNPGPWSGRGVGLFDAGGPG